MRSVMKYNLQPVKITTSIWVPTTCTCFILYAKFKKQSCFIVNKIYEQERP